MANAVTGRLRLLWSSGGVRAYKAYAINGNGMEQTPVDLITDDPVGSLLADRRFAIQLEAAKRILEAAKGRVDFLWLGEDLGTQIAPLISIQIFRKHIRARYQKFCDLAHAYGIPVMIHTCGSSS